MYASSNKIVALWASGCIALRWQLFSVPGMSTLVISLCNHIFTVMWKEHACANKCIALQMWGTTIPAASLRFPLFASHNMSRLCLTQIMKQNYLWHETKDPLEPLLVWVFLHNNRTLSGNTRASKLWRLNLLRYKVKEKERQERQKAKFLCDEDLETGDWSCFHAQTVCTLPRHYTCSWVYAYLS